MASGGLEVQFVNKVYPADLIKLFFLSVKNVNVDVGDAFVSAIFFQGQANPFYFKWGR